MDAGWAAIIGGMVGAAGAIGVWALNERASRRREERIEEAARAAREVEAARHRVEASREHTRELLIQLRVLSDTVAGMKIEQNGIRMNAVELNPMSDEAELISSPVVRRAVRTLRGFLTQPDWLIRRIPPVESVELEPGSQNGATIRGALGTVPTSVMQNLAISIVIDIVSAFAREEDPEAQVVPMFAQLMDAAEGLGLTARNLFG